MSPAGREATCPDHPLAACLHGCDDPELIGVPVGSTLAWATTSVFASSRRRSKSGPRARSQDLRVRVVGADVRQPAVGRHRRQISVHREVHRRFHALNALGSVEAGMVLPTGADPVRGPLLPRRLEPHVYVENHVAMF